MNTILAFLLILAFIISLKYYKKCLFIFPDSVKVTYVQGFLALLGFLNIFVSLPFLWDGDFDNGLKPLVIGLIALSIAIYFCALFNTNKEGLYKEHSDIYLNEDSALENPKNIKLGFLQGAKDRMFKIGPKYFFKELFLRHKDYQRLATILQEGSFEECKSAILTLPYVQDNYISSKDELSFCLTYMQEHNFLENLTANSEEFVDKVLKLYSSFDCPYQDIPYDCAALLANINLLSAFKDKEVKERFVINDKSLVCADDENIIALFRAEGFAFEKEGALLQFIKLVLPFKKQEARVLLTNYKLVIVINDKCYSVDACTLKTHQSKAGFISFDGQSYIKVDPMTYFLEALSFINKD